MSPSPQRLDAPPDKDLTERVSSSTTNQRKRLVLFFALAAALALAFAAPLGSLVRFALQNDLQSHILLVPFICLYLFRLHKQPLIPGKSTFGGAALFALGGVAALFTMRWYSESPTSALTLTSLAFVCFLVGIALFVFGAVNLRPHRFALFFLFFIVPLPDPAVTALSVALQHASAELSDITLRLTGMPVYREGLRFQMPGLLIFVAEECSGIRSTLVLFLTSILAAHLFLRTAWKQWLFVLIVFPLGVLRNAFRITTISWLTVNVDSGIIDSPLHHRGGPIFFIISLVPLFLVLWALRRTEPRVGKSC